MDTEFCRKLGFICNVLYKAARMSVVLSRLVHGSARITARLPATLTSERRRQRLCVGPDTVLKADG